MKLFTYPLYLLQLENYEVKRFWRLLFQKGFWSFEKPWRQEIVWTAKAKVLLFTAIFVHFLFSLILTLFLSFFFSLLSFPFIFSLLLIFNSLFYFVFFTIVIYFLWPLDYFLKRNIIKKAKKKVSEHKDLTIIGIAGSYGKTSLKETLVTLLSNNINVLSTPENINTPLGISNLILRELNPQTKVFIVEMGEYYQGDIAKICQITPPDIAILTGINEAHLERLGNLKTTIQTIFEIVDNSPKTALILLNADDDHVLNNYQRFIDNRPIKFYSSQNQPQTEYRTEKIRFNQGVPGISFEIKKDGKSLGEFQTAVLGDYVIGNIIASLIIAEKLSLKEENIKKNISKIKPVIHRLQPIKSPSNVLVIDDSYNGNPKGVGEAIKTLNRFDKRRKIYLTPGLVEMGSQTKEIHRQIGRDLSKVANLVILIKNSVSPYIAEGLQREGFNQSQILWFNSAQEAHKNLGNILKTGDVILFQNDWGDQYL